MNDTPRATLIEIIRQHGPQVIDDPQRVENLLRDLCPDSKREIQALMFALREQIPADLRQPPNGTPPVMLVANLTRRLIDNSPMAEDMARWAVESWALALGVIAAPLAPPPVSAPRPARPAMPPTQPVRDPSQISTQPARVTQRPGVLRLAPGVDLELVEVPAGKFQMGSDFTLDPDATPEEQPRHAVMLSSYRIGRYPVTNLQYRAFVQASGYPPPRDWPGGSIPTGEEQHPVTCVRWRDAQAFCSWANRLPGGRGLSLPTEAEWEKAARGPVSTNFYPWGPALPRPDQANFGRNVGHPTPVGAYSPQGDSPYGCADLAGNVWEWVNDWYSSSYYRLSPAVNPPGPAQGGLRVLRGGSWLNPPALIRCATRLWLNPDFCDGIAGFRVAIR